MRRHETDYVSLVAGGLFLVVAAVHFATQGTDAVTLQWTVAGLLVLLGLLGLLSVVRGAQAGGATASDLAGPDPGTLPDAAPVEHGIKESSTTDTTVLPREEGSAPP